MILSEIRQEARTKMQGLWGTCVPIWLIYLLIMMAIGAIGKFMTLEFLVSIVVGGPFTYSITKIFLRVYKQEPIELGQLFEGFNEFTRVFTAYALISLYVFLWMLLLIVPGIIAALGYSMTFFIMAENPSIPATEAMRQSKEMMQGHKWELFWLNLSFIGWFIICIFTFGIGLLWLGSYVASAIVIFYQKIKGKPEEIVLQPDEQIIHGADSLN